MKRAIFYFIFFFKISICISQNLSFVSKADSPIARGGSSCATQDEFAYISNGFSSTNQFSTEIEKYNFSDDTWSIFDTSAPTIEKKFGNAEIIANSLYLFNGSNFGANNDEIEIIDLATGNLTFSSSLNPNPVINGGSSVWGDNLITFGGSVNPFADDFSNKVYKRSLLGEWTQLADMPIGLETKGKVIYGNGNNSKLYVFGGYREINILAEEFSSIATGSTLISPNWINVAETGNKLFRGVYYNGFDKGVQITSYTPEVQDQNPSNKTWLISNEFAASQTEQYCLTFDTRVTFGTGATFEAYLITNWTGNITTSTKQLLNANIASVFNGITIHSGIIPLEGFVNNFRIAFKYSGGFVPLATTTFQLDNIRIFKPFFSKNIFIYDFANNSWTMSNSMLPQNLSTYALSVDNSSSSAKIYLTGNLEDQTFAGLYDTENDTFTTLTQTNLIARRNHNAEIWNNNLYLFGGNATSSETNPLNSTQSANLALLSIESSASQENLKLYPNPTSDLLYVPKNLTDLNVYSVNGTCMEISSRNGEISTEKLQKGTYVLVGLDKDGAVFKKKFLKK